MCFTRANERLARRHDEDYDDMVEEELEEEVGKRGKREGAVVLDILHCIHIRMKQMRRH